MKSKIEVSTFTVEVPTEDLLADLLSYVNGDKKDFLKSLDGLLTAMLIYNSEYFNKKHLFDVIGVSKFVNENTYVEFNVYPNVVRFNFEN